MDVLPLIWRYISPRNNKLWQTEIRDIYATLDVHGGEVFAESVDYFRTCWFVKLFERYAPL